ncbi:MAG: class I SAM-dependent rRNA methyltransferase [Deltaproteobacteria bacterium]|nr:class I SAM-dependent rRNA methyltransferase [Deltaproteobacteria bacterium]
MSEPTVTITRRGADRLAGGHPWIYRSDLAGEPRLAGGEVVRVVDARGWFRGRAFYSSKSQIALRQLTREDLACDRDFFAARIRAAKELREATFPGADAWRAVHGEADLLPGLVVDRYGDYLSVQLLTQGAEARRDLFRELLEEIYRPRGIVERSDAKVRLLEGLEQRKGLLAGQVPERVEYHEGEVVLQVDLMAGQKTGGFLDQRENRLALAPYARGVGLDCFSYVGGFALQLARGCQKVTAVEISEQMAPLIRDNARANGAAHLEVVTANAFDFLKQKTESAERYDIIVLDPPAFAKSKASVPAAERGYKEINLRGLQLLKPGGVLVSASCSFHLDEAHFEEILRSAAADSKRDVQIIEKRGAGRDHPVLLGVRETRYLKCFILRVA